MSPIPTGSEPKFSEHKRRKPFPYVCLQSGLNFGYMILETCTRDSSYKNTAACKLLNTILFGCLVGIWRTLFICVCLFDKRRQLSFHIWLEVFFDLLTDQSINKCINKLKWLQTPKGLTYQKPTKKAEVATVSFVKPPYSSMLVY